MREAFIAICSKIDSMINFVSQQQALENIGLSQESLVIINNIKQNNPQYQQIVNNLAKSYQEENRVGIINNLSELLYKTNEVQENTKPIEQTTWLGKKGFSWLV